MNAPIAVAVALSLAVAFLFLLSGSEHKGEVEVREREHKGGVGVRERERLRMRERSDVSIWSQLPRRRVAVCYWGLTRYINRILRGERNGEGEKWRAGRNRE